MAFVKFSRGLISTFNRLVNKDPDTLYLVYENENSLEGSLYLGNKLISSVGNTTNISLNDLANVSISNSELEDGMVLYYNASTGSGQWEAGRISDIVSELPAGRDRISIVDALNTISNPQDEDIAIVGQDVYVYSENEWHQLTDSSLIERVSSLENQIGHEADEEEGIVATGLYKEISDLKESVFTKEEILAQIADLSHLTYKKVVSLEAINVNADEASTTIYLVPKNSEDESDGYDEYFVIDGQLEKIGSWDVNLSNYVTFDDNRLLSPQQKEKIDSLGYDSENHVATIQAAQVGGLSEAIANGQLIKRVDAGTFRVTEQGELQLVSIPSIDLTGYVTTEVFDATVGNLEDIQNRESENSTLVDEINVIKNSIIWHNIISESQEENNG